MPHNARRQYNNLLGMQEQLEELSEHSWLNRLIPGTGLTGVLAFGIAFNYVMEVRQACQP